MRRNRTISGRKNESGVIIMLVAVFLLFVVGAMAVLAIDVVTFYTARNEAQQAADGAALAGGRALANSGVTSNPTDSTLVTNAENLALTLATQVARQNKVGGRNLNGPEVVVTFQPALLGNPRITVKITRDDLPTFFARIWGRTTVSVSASAMAEAYNPSGPTVTIGGGPPVAPLCVKPWLMPNIDPTGTSTAAQIFDPTTGAILNPLLLGKSWPNLPTGNPKGLFALCNAGGIAGDCSGAGLLPFAPGGYYPGAIGATPLEFPVPTRALQACSAGFNNYQLAVSGCVPRPIACGATANINIDTASYSPKNGNRDADTVEAVSCLAHAKNGAGDTIDNGTTPPPPPFQFLAGSDNPVVPARNSDVLVSDSLVTIPVFDSSGPNPPATSTVKVIGFLQVFLNPQGTVIGGSQVPATIVNMAGCGAAVGQPILGNGASPVLVRLVTP